MFPWACYCLHLSLEYSLNHQDLERGVSSHAVERGCERMSGSLEQDEGSICSVV